MVDGVEWIDKIWQPVETGELAFSVTGTVSARSTVQDNSLVNGDLAMDFTCVCVFER